MIKKTKFKVTAIVLALIFFFSFIANPAYALPVASSIYTKDASGNFTATAKTINVGQSLDFEIKSANTEGDTISEVRLYITRANNSTRDANGRLAAYDTALCTRQGGTNDGFGNCYFPHTINNLRLSTDNYNITFPQSGIYYVFTSAAKSYATQQAWCTGSPYCSWYTGPAGDNCASYSTECINPPGTTCGSGSYTCSNAVTVTVQENLAPSGTPPANGTVTCDSANMAAFSWTAGNFTGKTISNYTLRINKAPADWAPDSSTPATTTVDGDRLIQTGNVTSIRVALTPGSYLDWTLQPGFSDGTSTPSSYDVGNAFTCPGGNPTAAPTDSPGPTPTGAPIPAVIYRIAETQAGLASDPFQSDPNRSRTFSYSGNPTTQSYIFSGAAGEKTLWVRFFYSTDLTSNNFVDHGPFRIIYRPPSTPAPTQAPVADPEVTTVSCVTDTNNPDHTRVTAIGTSFGSQAGTLKLGGIDGVISSGGWGNTNIVAVVPRKFITPQQVVVTRIDGKSGSKLCALDGSLIQFSASLTCRFVNKPVQKASIQIITEGSTVGVGTSITGGQIAYRNDEVEFDQNGTALNVVPTAKLVPTAPYNLVIRAPNALRRKISFVAGALNTTQTLPGDEGNAGKYKLLLGDIFPAGSENVLSITGGDNSVSSSDYSVLKSKWSPTADIQTSADFNQDKRVNTIDYACISSNINKPAD